MQWRWEDGVSRAFELGDPVQDPVSLSGARAHRVWKLRTTKGIFVAKALNPYHAGDEEGLAQIRDKIRLELAARDQGIRMPAPVPAMSGDYLAQLPDPMRQPHWWRVHQWIEGVPPSWQQTSHENARWVGQTLSTVHQLASPYSSDPGAAPLIPLDNWEALADRARAAGAGWAAKLRSGLADINRMNTYAATRFALRGLLRSHAEFDQRNVLIGLDGQPYLLDWDSLIYLHPTAELFAAAMNWAGVNPGDPNLDIAADVLNAYRATSPIIGSLADHTGYWCAWQLGWLWFAALRALGDDVAPVDTADRPVSDILVKLDALPNWLTSIDQWATQLDG